MSKGSLGSCMRSNSRQSWLTQFPRAICLLQPIFTCNVSCHGKLGICDDFKFFWNEVGTVASAPCELNFQPTIFPCLQSPLQSTCIPWDTFRGWEAENLTWKWFLWNMFTNYGLVNASQCGWFYNTFATKKGILYGTFIN